MSRRAPPEAEAGAIAPLVALLLASLFGFAGLAVDMGLVQYQRRSLQAAVDAAALSAARAPLQAQAIATTVLTRNGGVSGTPSIVAGNYVDDPALATAARFAAGGTLNAVRVTARRDVGLGLSRVLGAPATTPVNATAIAAHQALAAFSIGSGVLSLDGGILNQVLGSLLNGGGNVLTLSAAGYSGLAASKVRLFGTADALATSLGLGAGNYQSLLAANTTIGRILGLSAGVLAPAADAAAGPALDILSQTTNAGRAALLGSLLTLNVHQTRQVGDFAADSSYANLGINALDLATAAAALGGANAVALPTNINLPLVATIATRLLVIEPPQSSPVGSFGLGTVGVSVDTAQTRALLSVQLLTLVSGGAVSLPVFVEAAPAQARLASIACQGDPSTDSAVGIQATTGVARAQIGQISTADFANPGMTFGTLPPVALLRLPLTVTVPLVGNVTVSVVVSAQAAATIGSNSATLNFTAAEIAAGTPQSLASSALSGSLVQSLGNSLNLSISADLGGILAALQPVVKLLVDPLLPGILNTVRPLLTVALAPVFNLLDGTIDQILAAAGVRLGFASVRATGVRCGIAALVL